MSTKKRKAPRIAGAKDRLIAQREAEARAKRARRRTSAITLAMVVVLLIGGAGLYGWYATHKQPVADAVPSTSASASASAERAYAAVKVADSTGLTIGFADAPNTVTIYSDFACAHCQEFEAAYGPTLSTLVQAGGIRIEYWPLGIFSEGSARASNAMACAAERDATFGQNMYDGIFGNFGLDWSNDQLISLATQMAGGGLPDGFETCVTSGTHAGWVKSIYATAKAGPAAKGAPVVLVNGANFDLTTGTADSLTALLK
ncbi:MAG: DsbA family protein [Propionibacteriaceae bacterium]